MQKVYKFAVTQIRCHSIPLHPIIIQNRYNSCVEMSQVFNPNETMNIALGHDRYVYTKIYEGRVYLDIREFYYKNQNIRHKPIGVMLTQDDWAELQTYFNDIRDVMVSRISKTSRRSSPQFIQSRKLYSKFTIDNNQHFRGQIKHTVNFWAQKS